MECKGITHLVNCPCAGSDERNITLPSEFKRPTCDINAIISKLIRFFNVEKKSWTKTSIIEVMTYIERDKGCCWWSSQKAKLEGLYVGESVQTQQSTYCTCDGHRQCKQYGKMNNWSLLSYGIAVSQFCVWLLFPFLCIHGELETVKMLAHSH